MDRRDIQLAANEAMFRDVNETVAEAASGRKHGESVRFLCECADEFCAESVDLTLARYEEIRRTPEYFFIRPGHFRPEVERIIEQHRDYWLVEKFGEAAEVAEETDPRT